MNQVVEYEPKRRRHPLTIWILLGVGLMLYFAWAANDNKRIQVEARARAEAQRKEKVQRLIDAAILQELQGIRDQNERAAWLKVENARREEIGLEPLKW